jgi:hypothetical protein
MKRSLVLALSVAMAMPVITLPVTPADAQVLTGRNAPRRPAPAPRPALTEAEETRLYEAEDQVFEIDRQLAEIQAASEAQGGLTEAQQAHVDTLNRRREEAQRIIDRLEAKRNR